MGQPKFIGLKNSSVAESRANAYPFRTLHSQSRNAEIIRSFPWAVTPLGAMQDWDANLFSNLELVLDATFPMFLCWGDDLHLLYNSAFEIALVGKGDCIGRPVREVFPEIWPDVRGFFENALSGDASYLEDLPLRLVRNDQPEETWWSISYSPVRDEAGVIRGVLAVVYETTRRVSAEAELRLREAELVALTDAAPNLMWRCDPDGVLTWANPALHAYFGLTSLSGVRWGDHVHPADARAARAIHDQSLRTLRAFEAQQRLFAADGRVHWFMVSATPILDDAGLITGWFGSAADIDEWRRAADELTDRDELLHRFSESEEALMWVGEASTRKIQALNRDCAEAWSLPPNPGGVNWETWIQFAHPDDRPQLSIVFDQAAAGEVAQARFRSAPTAPRMRRYHVTAFAMPGETTGRRVGGMIVEVASADDPKVYLIDPRLGSRNAMSHGLTRKGFRVRTFDDAAEFQKIAGDLAPGCVVVAVREDVEPIAKLAAALKRDRRLPWIAFGDLSGRLEDAVALMKLGARDILNAPTSDEVASAGNAALAVAFGKRSEPPQGNGGQRKIDQLSPRERQVLEGLVAGGTNKSIAKDLNLSPRTVETHRAHLMDRLGVGTLAELIKLAAGG
jgi:PAS domain S-box-containing protein